MIPLDIFADPVCPWCLIGKARLDRALEARPDHPFVIAWHPFQLNPTMPPEGMDRAAYLRAKFGPEAAGYDAPLIAAAAEAGVAMDLTAVRRMPNTMDAHRLLHWAALEGRQTPVMAALMRAFWREGRDIGLHAELIEIARRAGIEAEVVARLLGSDADRDEIARRDAHARERGIRAVPTVILDDRYVIAGAQTVAFWTDVIDEIAGQAD